ncbi:MAG TPA: Trm112 family protein [Tepidisphaeraceae bacterium]|nr:Trm112 family protein [Tepidisphaeraceae bacterium]
MLESQSASNTVDPELLAILRCPLTHSPLRQEGDFLVAEIGGLRYPVRDGIPAMLMEEAQLPPGVASLDDFKQQFKDQISR